jgi:hypothetical protein
MKRLIALGIVEYRKGLGVTLGFVLSPRGRETLESYNVEI